MKQRVTLYEPHAGHPQYGHRGAIATLPKPMREIVAELNGQSMTLEDAIKKIAPIADDLGGEIEIVEEYKIIWFSHGPHTYRLLRYK